MTQTTQETPTIRVVSDGCSRQQGGLFHSVRRLWQAVHARGIPVELNAVRDQHTDEDIVQYAPLAVRAFPDIGPRALGFSPGLKRHLLDPGEHYEVLSSHGLWMHASYAAGVASRRRGKPHIIHPHGMLDPWAFNRRRLKNTLLGRAFQFDALRRARAIRVLCESEAESVRALGFKSPLVVIPNGVNLAEFDDLPSAEKFSERIPSLRNRRKLLFLSRVHPKKGLEPLIRAWASSKAGERDWALVIAGPNQAGHREEMDALAGELGHRESVVFVGGLYHEEKREALSGADGFILPSFSEGFTMAILEAAACRLPIVMTPQCNFPEMAEAGGAISVEPTVEELTRGLNEFLEMDDSEREQMGGRARTLVESHYTWDIIAEDMIKTCQWACGGGQPPARVRLD